MFRHLPAEWLCRNWALKHGSCTHRNYSGDVLCRDASDIAIRAITKTFNDVTAV